MALQNRMGYQYTLQNNFHDFYMGLIQQWGLFVRIPISEGYVPTLGAIDIGSNGIRLAVGFVDPQGRLHPIEDFREPVRLGEDVFTRGIITRPTLDRAVHSLLHFKILLRQYGVTRTRAVATSALRESRNRNEVLRFIRQKTGINVKTINTEEEAYLVRLAVSERINFSKRSTLLFDLGGGSLEVTMLKNGKVIATESFNMGAVRLLKLLEGSRTREPEFNRMVEEYADVAQRHIMDKFKGTPPSLCVGTGGNLDQLGSLRRTLLNAKDADSFVRRDLERIIHILKKTSYEDRVRKFGLRPDRADVILPAAIVVEKLIRSAGVHRVWTPGVGLKDGLLRDMAAELKTGHVSLNHAEVIDSAVQLGRKYCFDEAHARHVTNLSLILFDQTRKFHRLDENDRLALEIASLLHDIGQFVSLSSHHKHAYFLIRSSHLMGLDDKNKEIVANVARYHRKSSPTLKHENFRRLSPFHRRRVIFLSALLRIADALDYEHSGKIRGLDVTIRKKWATFHLQGRGDLLLEKWSLIRKGDLFERVFKLRCSVLAQKKNGRKT